MARQKKTTESKTFTISVSSRKITTSWWGMAWQDKITSYSDYANRLPRARSYLRNGKVRELAIEPNFVTAKVKGTRPRPYNVQVYIEPLSDYKKQVIRQLFNEQISSVEELLTGSFPKALADQFLKGDCPLFPTDDEISFYCSCPDMAYLCKHVGAVLYSIGVVFDEDPSLFFKLRNLEIGQLVQATIDERLDVYLEHASKASERQIVASDVNEIFGEL